MIFLKKQFSTNLRTKIKCYKIKETNFAKKEQEWERKKN